MRLLPARPLRLLLVVGLLLQFVSPVLADSLTGHFAKLELGLPVFLTPKIAPSNLFFRANISVKHASDWHELTEMEVEILERREDSATIIATTAQLEMLARLQFQPRHINELSHLMQVNASEHPMLARSLQPMLESVAEAESARGGEMPSFGNLVSLDETQREGLHSLPDADGDSDGLSDTEVGLSLEKRVDR